MNTLLDKRSLEFRKRSRHLEHQLAHRGRGIDCLLIEIQIVEFAAGGRMRISGSVDATTVSALIRALHRASSGDDFLDS
jgi:hypothetical protein